MGVLTGVGGASGGFTSGRKEIIDLLSQKVAEKMLEKGIYVTGFFYPVVPKDKARIRTQMSAGHSKEDIDKCVQAFVECKKELGF